MDHFFLTSHESESFKRPIRSCLFIKRLEIGGRNDLALVKILPSYKYIDSNQNFIELEEVVLASRYMGDSIFEPEKWPMDVYISTFKKKSSTDLVLKLEIIAWGEIHNKMPREESI